MRDHLITGEPEKRCSNCAHARGFSCGAHTDAHGKPRFIAAARTDEAACGAAAKSFAPKVAPQTGIVIEFPKAGRFA